MDAIAPLTEGIANALAKLVDDAQSTRRDPAHDALNEAAKRSGVLSGDPAGPSGKAKRVRGMLFWALSEDSVAGSRFVTQLVALVRASGGFRPESANYCGEEAITNLRDQFAHEGWGIDAQGFLQPAGLPAAGSARTQALKDLAMKVATGQQASPKVPHEDGDILIVTAGWAVELRYSGASPSQNGAVLLATAFSALGLPMPGSSSPPSALDEYALAMFATGQALIRLRTTGSQPVDWITVVDEHHARMASRAMGNVALFMLQHMG